MASSKISKPFPPGENFVIKKKWFKKAIPLHREIEVTSPGRLHFSIIDFLKMKPPNPGGGGLGISTSVVKNKVRITVVKKQKNRHNCQKVWVF